MVRRFPERGSKRKRVVGNPPSVTELEDENKEENPHEEQCLPVRELPSLPLNPDAIGKAIFVIQDAALTLSKGSLKKALGKKKGKKRGKILNSEEDADFLLREKMNIDDFRPDIMYEALRTILDSPLNKAGMVGTIYVKIKNGALFEVKPHVRLPRTLKRFCGIMLDLLEKSRVCAKDTGEMLLRVIEEPLTRHLPVNCHIVGLSYHSEKLVDIEDYVSARRDDLNHVFMVGAMAHGIINKEYTNDFISVSQYPLGAKCCVGLICEALERKWNIF